MPPARYTLEDLKRLRASPLVSKPDGLPPTEEWMGPPPENPPQRKLPQPRGRAEDGQNPSDASSRRPSGLERKISTAPDDIVLGPPKTAFSSSARNLGKDKAIDSPDAVSGPNYNFREKFFKDRDVPGEDERRDSKLGGRRGGREDRDEWQNGRRKPGEQEEAEYKAKRNGERDRDRDFTRWGPKDTKVPAESGVDGKRGTGDRDDRYGARREGQARAKFDRPWTRVESTQAAEDEGKADTKQREWRRDRGATQGDREWNRPGRVEQDPEWMDALEPEDTKTKKTAQDFEAWKASMNANKATKTPVEETSSPFAAVEAKEEARPVAKRENGDSLGKASTPFALDTSVDGFFGLFNPKKPAQEKNTPTEAETKKVPPKSRFANLFSPDVEVSKEQVDFPPPPPSVPPPQPAERPVSTAANFADQEGFNRILKMLGTARTPSLPQVPQSEVRERNVQVTEEKARHSQEPERRTQQPGDMDPHHGAPLGLTSPVQPGFPVQDRPTRRAESPRNRQSAGLESLIATHPPREPPSHQRDVASDRDNSDFLLRLMQQSNIAPHVKKQPPPPPQQQHTAGHTPGILQMPPSMGRPPGIPARDPGARQFFDDPAIANMRRPDSNEPREGIRRRPTNGPLPAFFDESFYQEHRPNSGNPGAGPLGHGHPLGMQRPPGFDPAPPPGWPNHQHPPQHQHQQQGLGPLNPPPGIPNPLPRGMPLNFNGGPMPHNVGMPPNERQQLPRGAGMPNFPPGMPPPGYMNPNGPPPGFPPMDHAPHVMSMGPNAAYGNSGMPPRNLMDLFGAPDQYVGRGGVPGAYR